MKKYIRIVLLVLFSIVLGWSTGNIFRGYKAKKATETRIQTLPDVGFSDLTGNEINLHDFDKTKPVVIIYFHRECEHCQYEAKEISQNAKAFTNCQLVLVSANDSIKQLEDFCNEYNLWEVDNIEVLVDKQNLFKKTFGKAVIPSVYIYDDKQKLKKRFLGETKPEAIISEIEYDPEH